MVAIPLVADGADSEDDLQLGIDTLQQLQEHLPLVNDVVSIKPFAHKEVVWLFVAVGNQHTCLFQAIDDGSAEGDNQYICFAQESSHLMGSAVDARHQFRRVSGRKTAVVHP